jgi:hypothetical protein
MSPKVYKWLAVFWAFLAGVNLWFFAVDTNNFKYFSLVVAVWCFFMMFGRMKEGQRAEMLDEHLKAQNEQLRKIDQLYGRDTD